MITPGHNLAPALLLAVLLTACAGSPSTVTPGPDAEPRRSQGRAISEVGTTPETYRIDGEFADIHRAIIDQDYEQAATKLTLMNTARLDPDELLLHGIYSARLLVAENKYSELGIFIQNASLRAAMLEANPGLARQFANEMAQLCVETGNYLEAAKLWVQATVTTPAASDRSLSENIWRALMRAEQDRFEAARQTQIDYQLRGWLELARIVRPAEAHPAAIAERVGMWLANWESHPARSMAANLLAEARVAASRQPSQIALMLPLSGQLADTGKAIRDGFLAAYFASKKQTINTPELRIYDTADGGDIRSIYTRAARNGADLVIGPLLKRRVEALASSGPLPVPVLSLNRIDAGQSQTQLTQLSLAPEDEAIQLAEVAAYRSPGQALMLYPAGSWGEKVSQALNGRWLELGNSIPASAVHDRLGDLSTTIKQALDIDDSEERSRRLARTLGRSNEFVPRRRQDLAAVFLLAGRPDLARTIRPMLAFHYAGDIPVYTLSSSHDAQSSSVQATDLDGVVLTEIPWELATPSPLRQSVAAAVSSSANESRMNALGVDAYHLHMRLALIDQPLFGIFRGATGTLQLDSDRHLLRELLIAHFVDGRRKVEPALPL